MTAVVATGSGAALPAPVAPVAPPAFDLSGLGEGRLVGKCTEPSQERWGALHAAPLLGFVWAAWRFARIAHAGHAPASVVGWTILTVATRAPTVRIFDNAGRRVSATALLHAGSNVCTVLFAAYVAPKVTAPTAAAMPAAVVARRGPRTPARFRWA